MKLVKGEHKTLLGDCDLRENFGSESSTILGPL
jgi:hypothetical protein